jgi:hypothetical protein
MFAGCTILVPCFLLSSSWILNDGSGAEKEGRRKSGHSAELCIGSSERMRYSSRSSTSTDVTPRRKKSSEVDSRMNGCHSPLESGSRKVSQIDLRNSKSKCKRHGQRSLKSTDVTSTMQEEGKRAS